MNSQLKLIGQDAEDLEIIASLLQDAIIPAETIRWMGKDKIFAFIAQRFCWDKLADTDALLADKTTAATAKPKMTIDGFERVSCFVEVKPVINAQQHGFERTESLPAGQVLELLTINLDLTTDAKILTFIFAGDAKIRLGLEDGWQIRLGDYGEPWPTTSLPRH